MSTRRMVALYDYDPRESSPNVDVEVKKKKKRSSKTSSYLNRSDASLVFMNSLTNPANLRSYIEKSVVRH